MALLPQIITLTFKRMVLTYSENYSMTVKSSTNLSSVVRFARTVISSEQCKPPSPRLLQLAKDNGTCSSNSNVDFPIQFECPSLQKEVKAKGRLSFFPPNKENTRVKKALVLVRYLFL
eukprot:m.131698 g.131698  ORF g.131698 m.131698 type:complete len:118 (+) comp38049_c0_seq2:542-895(+)